MTDEVCAMAAGGWRAEAPARRFHPDPRTKLALLLLWAVAVFLSPGLWFEVLMMLLAAAFGFASGRGRLALGMLALYAAMMALMMATAQMDAGVLKTMLSSFFMLVRKVFPCGLLAAIIVTTTHVNEFMSALARMRAPLALTIPLAVMLRYVPAIREDWRFIKDAMRMRGVTPSLAGFLRRPAMTVECLYVPLLMSASNVADELSMASMARGIENPAPRTCYLHIAFRVQDGLLLTAGAAVLASAVACGVLGLR
ncbi:energy-coupling factor transporter transmembrane component T [Eggerthella sinensis]|uniref:energy-coupling factor transporter transmembrane component T n=1 Tax=Eggerthella sinensis TaxID=242230 RepID=UPI001D09165A|nr:energy-coupling factor transporter transmembrane component T [Eggerthella sinensis]MCB7037555.1 energy-coupling factor transporter transmembrane protein EcfT [Eggerthella sinensis]